MSEVSRPMCKSVLLILLVGVSLAASFSPGEAPASAAVVKGRFVVPEVINGSASGWSSRPTQTRTMRESAVMAEWERRSELDRRIEDGTNYYHYDDIESPGSRKQPRQNRKKTPPGDSASPIPGVFCGFRSTPEEYNRLKSAHLSV